ncbi:hypothetical protein RIF29_06674 [Crotalaria pallida]|uniref:MACPF domain-containing protein n=1 Tax=Crotalaria pallida TaxID=3830 RepID=A0AAN9J3F5_CROPI
MSETAAEKGKGLGLDAKGAVEAAISSIGFGYDICNDLSFNYCKTTISSRLIDIDDEDQFRNVELPGALSIPNVPKSIKCYPGERLRLRSDVLSFQQMAAQFNKELSLSGMIPSGHFNAAFDLSGVSQRDAANTKALAFDGHLITLCNIAYEKRQLVLCDLVKHDVPLSWDPAALARFIEKYGTHVLIGMKIGGADFIYAKQPHCSPLQPDDVEKDLKEKADKFFIDSAGQSNTNDGRFNGKEKVQEIEFLHKRKGGSGKNSLSHKEWCQTVMSQPDVISMSFIPITSLLGGINGSGFLTHAINLYLRYKPPIEDLHQFLELQLPRQWAPVLSEIYLGSHRKNQVKSGLRLGILGPMLYINTIPVDVGNRPVTGLRLQLEGASSNRLAIHLQHLASLPAFFPLSDNANVNLSCDDPHSCNFHKKVKWNCSLRVCTAPVESDDSAFIVTGAQLIVERNCLILRLRFSKVIGATLKKPPEWDESSSHQLLHSSFSHRSGCICIFPFMTKRKEGHIVPKPGDVTVGSSAYPSGLPAPVHPPELLRFVSTREIVRGPEDSPGYWVVSGAKLSVQDEKIYLFVKYSLLSFVNTSRIATP